MKKASDIKAGDKVCLTVDRVWHPLGSRKLVAISFERKAGLKEGISHQGGYMIFNEDDEIERKNK